MSTLDLGKDSKRKPDELVSDVELSDDAVAMLADASNTFSYIQALCERELFDDAFLTLARTLPKQYAIVWATNCVEDAASEDLKESDRSCLDLVKKWLGGPDEKLRRAALDAADASDYEGQYAWLAAAVGFSGGSLTPENQVGVPPAHHLTAVAVSACLLNVANQDEDKLAENAVQIVDRGLAIAAVPGG
jgi:hypothetical protein